MTLRYQAYCGFIGDCLVDIVVSARGSYRRGCDEYSSSWLYQMHWGFNGDCSAEGVYCNGHLLLVVNQNP